MLAEQLSHVYRSRSNKERDRVGGLPFSRKKKKVGTLGLSYVCSPVKSYVWCISTIKPVKGR